MLFSSAPKINSFISSMAFLYISDRQNERRKLFLILAINSLIMYGQFEISIHFYFKNKPVIIKTQKFGIYLFDSIRSSVLILLPQFLCYRESTTVSAFLSSIVTCPEWASAVVAFSSKFLHVENVIYFEGSNTGCMVDIFHVFFSSLSAC